MDFVFGAELVGDDQEPDLVAGVPLPEAGLFSASGIRPVFSGVVPYLRALQTMEKVQRERAEGRIPDTFYYLEHEPVITYGRLTPEEHLGDRQHDVPMIEVPRGGQATYHGPGQLIGYGIIDLSLREGGLRPDIHAYLRALEDGLIRYLKTDQGIAAFRRSDHTGVWVGATGEPRKIASIGVSVRRWVTAHGFALNVSPDLDSFRLIVPCGGDPGAMTSIEHEMRLAGREYRYQRMKHVASRVHVYVSLALREHGWCRPTR